MTRQVVAGRRFRLARSVKVAHCTASAGIDTEALKTGAAVVADQQDSIVAVAVVGRWRR